jgi:hypothetical protein
VKPPSSNATSDALRFSYEDLRTQVLADSRGPGLATFLHYGIREWIEDTVCLRQRTRWRYHSVQHPGVVSPSIT